MARTESEREDLIREATALVRRVEFTVPAESNPIIAGFRRDGSLAVYFDQDPVYQFDAIGRLRRAFIDGHLYRTQGATLARLTRVRTANRTQLLRTDLSPEQLQSFTVTMHSELTKLVRADDEGEIQASQQIPAEDSVAADAIAFLRDVLSRNPGLAPAIAGKR